jgi:putative nucleotidyltransferase with HDIG domain
MTATSWNTAELVAREPSDVRDRVEKARTAEREGRWRDARAEYETLIRHPGALPQTRLKAMRWLGRAHLEEGNHEAALDALNVAIVAADEAGDMRSVAQAINIVGIARQKKGDLDAASEAYEAARHRAETAGDKALLAMIDQNVGTLASIRGDLPGALKAFRASLNGYSALGMKEYRGQVLNNIGLAYLEMGEHAAAESAYRDAITSFRDSADRANSLNVAVNQIQLWVAMRHFDRALEQCSELIESAKTTEHPWLAEVHRHLAVIARERTDFHTAETYFIEAANSAEASGDLLLLADIYEQHAELCWVQGRHRQMLERLNDARGLYSTLRAERRIADVGRRNKRLEDRFLEIAKRWGDSIEGKDHYTQGHCERVADLASRLAERAGVLAESIFWFRLGALLHDVGKLIVPPEVLNKGEELTEEEWVLMRRHPVAGLELLKDIDFPGDIRSMIRSHHERWDGSGYPDQVSGTSIPLNARILCIADVYDALTTTRAYRNALDHARAIETMRESQGQFDPDLLRVFLEWAEEEHP